jgi:hypothetical protein
VTADVVTNRMYSVQGARLTPGAKRPGTLGGRAAGGAGPRPEGIVTQFRRVAVDADGARLTAIRRSWRPP